VSIGVKLLKEHRYKELWERYCGFIDLTVEEFMAMQRHLLLEQLELLRGCQLGRHLMAGATPTTVDEFRALVPLNSYEDHAPFLNEQREAALPAKPVLWQRTAGTSSANSFKWVPVTQRMYQEMGRAAFAVLILATCKNRGDINFDQQEKILYALAPPPYATGCWGRLVSNELPLHFLPSLDKAEEMAFEERLALGLREGMSEGIDLLLGMPSVVVSIGERVGQKKTSAKELLLLLARPRALLRLAKGLIKSKLSRRPLMPKDLWSLRGLATAGRDAFIYRQRIQELWGVDLLDVYGSTEGLIIAMQTWDRQGMTFLPYFHFLEFIPEEEVAKSSANEGYQPNTVLLDGVEAGKQYEIVITNFHGGAFVRYRLGDMVSITSLGNERLNITLPQMTFYSRSDRLIDLAGFTRLTQRTIGEAIIRAGFNCEEWTARKEFAKSPLLHLYLELRSNDKPSVQAVETAIHEELKRIDRPYAEIETMLGSTPLKVSLLPSGSFQRYAVRQHAKGADLAHLVPPHINPSDEAIEALLDGRPAVREKTALRVGSP